MRRIVMPVVAAAVLAGAYTVTFGLPSPVKAMIGNGVLSATATTQNAAAPAARASSPTGPRGGAKPTMVVTTSLKLEPYESVLNAIGTASAIRSVDVVANAAGTVTETYLTSNLDVEAGEVLVRLDARAETLNLEIAQAELDQASETLSRYQRLQAGGNSTVTDVTLSEARVSQRLAEAAVGLAQVALVDRTIRAPIAGRVGLSDIGVGDVLAANSAVVSIDQSDALLVEFELPEWAIGLLAEAKTVFATSSTFIGRVFDGQIVSFDSRIDSVTRSVTVKARIDNPDGVLWPGMTFAVRLVQESDPLPALPSTAIAWSRSGSTIWIDTNGIAEQVPVTILFRRGDTVWIDAEIAEGTMVVSEGAQKLRVGARIMTPAGADDHGVEQGKTAAPPATVSRDAQQPTSEEPA